MTITTFSAIKLSLSAFLNQYGIKYNNKLSPGVQSCGISTDFSQLNLFLFNQISAGDTVHCIAQDVFVKQFVC